MEEKLNRIIELLEKQNAHLSEIKQLMREEIQGVDRVERRLGFVSVSILERLKQLVENVGEHKK